MCIITSFSSIYLFSRARGKSSEYDVEQEGSKVQGCKKVQQSNGAARDNKAFVADEGILLHKGGGQSRVV